MLTDFDNISQNIKRDYYPLIGSGSGRYVYDLGNGYVVKKARNHKGIAQNEVEYRIYMHTHSEILAKIIAVSENYKYLVMEKAERIGSLLDVWNYYHVNSANEFFRTDLFRNTASEYGLLPNDLYRKTSWGMINERPVIIDYGYTEETRKLYTLFPYNRRHR